MVQGNDNNGWSWHLNHLQASYILPPKLLTWTAGSFLFFIFHSIFFFNFFFSFYYERFFCHIYISMDSNIVVVVLFEVGCKSLLPIIEWNDLSSRLKILEVAKRYRVTKLLFFSLLKHSAVCRISHFHDNSICKKCKKSRAAYIKIKKKKKNINFEKLVHVRKKN